MFYCSTFNCTIYNSAGAMSFDTELMKAQTYIAGVGMVKWDIVYHKVVYNPDNNIVMSGVFGLKCDGISSVIVISDTMIEQNIDGYEKILMIKNRYADRKLHSRKIRKIKREGLDLIRWSQQSCYNNR